MKITTQSESIAPCQHKLQIEVPIENVAEEFKRVAAQFQSIAQLPGFRPGRVPQAMVEKRFAQQIEDDVKRALIPESYRAAVAEQKLHAVGSPKIENIEFGRNQPLRYTATVETAPDFALPEYKNIPVAVTEPNVSDEDVENALKALLEQRAEFTDITGRPLALGDFSVINFEGVSDGKPIAEIAPRAKSLSEAKNFWLAINSEAFLSNFCNQLVGANIGEKRQVQIDFPADFAVKELQGAKATYFVDIIGIKEKKLPPLDDAFAQELKVENLATLRDRMRHRLQHDRENQVDAEKRNQIVSALLSRVNFDLPPSLVAAETRQIIYDIVRSLKTQGATDDVIEQEKDKIFGSAQRNAADRVKTQLILGRIAEAEKIGITREEIDHQVAHLAQHNRVPARQLRAQLEERGAIGAMAEEILTGKVLDFLLQNAKVEAPKIEEAKP